MTGRVVIFDFDGTLADSFGVAMNIFHQLTGGRHALDDEAVQALRGLPAGKVMKELGVSIWRAPFMLGKGRAMMGDRIQELTLFEGLGAVIETLHRRGYRMFILSSNSAENIMRFTETYKIAQYFEGIYGGVGLFSKARHMRRVLRANRLQAADCVYIGDEARDVHAAKRVGIDCISVSWGYNTALSLEATKPMAIAHVPTDLLRILAAKPV